MRADELCRRRREGAVSDVLDDGMSVVGAAARWKVPVDELEQLVAEARGVAQGEP